MALVSDRFQAKVAVGLPDECWEWQGSRNGDGYGQLVWEGKTVKASRLVLAWKLGRPIAPGKSACHSCDNPPCCNPNHLWQGTHRDNMLDSYHKNRLKPPPQTPEAQAKQRANTHKGDQHWMRDKGARLARLGEANPNSKLTWEQVGEIRRLRAEGKLLKEIAPLFGISLVLVSLIVRHEIWAEEGYERRKARLKRPPVEVKPLDRPKRGPRGSENGRAKLTTEQVQAIRDLYSAGGVTQAELGRRFGTTQTNICMIVTGRGRQHS